MATAICFPRIFILMHSRSCLAKDLPNFYSGGSSGFRIPFYMSHLLTIILLQAANNECTNEGIWSFQMKWTWDDGVINSTGWDRKPSSVTLYFDAFPNTALGWSSCDGLYRAYATVHKYLCVKYHQKRDCDDVGEFYCPYWQC